MEFPLRFILLLAFPMLFSLQPIAYAKPTNYDKMDTASNTSYGSLFNTLRQPYYPPNADCVDYMIPVDISYDNFVYNGTKLANDYDLTNFLTVATTRAGAGYPAPLDGPNPTRGSFQIAASFCTPKNQTAKAKNVIVATHGIGPARAHWNSPYQPEQYNFVQYAIGQGYSVFFYDRLGCGASEK
jgi:pimeloyl-ACP methyl ester carboxylesterase